MEHDRILVYFTEFCTGKCRNSYKIWSNEQNNIIIYRVSQWYTPVRSLPAQSWLLYTKLSKIIKKIKNLFFRTKPRTYQMLTINALKKSQGVKLKLIYQKLQCNYNLVLSLNFFFVLLLINFVLSLTLISII